MLDPSCSIGPLPYGPTGFAAENRPWAGWIYSYCAPACGGLSLGHFAHSEANGPIPPPAVAGWQQTTPKKIDGAAKTCHDWQSYSVENQNLCVIESLGDLIGPPPYGPTGFAVEGCLWMTVFPGSI